MCIIGRNTEWTCNKQWNEQTHPVQYWYSVPEWPNTQSNWARVHEKRVACVNFHTKDNPLNLELCTLENAPVTSFKIYIKSVKVFKLSTSENLCFAFFFICFVKSVTHLELSFYTLSLLVDSLSLGWPSINSVF